MSKSYNYQPAGTTTVTTTGNIAQLDPQGNSVILMNNASLSTIQGIKAGYPGQKVTIISIGAGEVDLAHQNSSASANDRLINYVTSGITPLAAGVGTCQYQYDDITNRWRLINHNQGALIDIPYNAGNFTASSGTWTVDSGDQTTFSFYLTCQCMMLLCVLTDTSLSLAANNLSIKLPNGYTINKISRGPFTFLQNSTAGTGMFSQAVASTVIICFTDAAAATSWIATTNGTRIDINNFVFIN